MSEQTALTRGQKLRRTNKAGIAELFGVHVSTVDAWIRRGCPALRRGSLSQPWEFDALDVMRWRFEKDAPRAPVDPDLMTPPDRRAWYQSEHLRRQLRIRDAELIPREEVEECVELVTRIINTAVREFPACFVAQAGAGPEVTRTIEKTLEGILDHFNDSMASVVQVKGRI